MVSWSSPKSGMVRGQQAVQSRDSKIRNCLHSEMMTTMFGIVGPVLLTAIPCSGDNAITGFGDGRKLIKRKTIVL
jgi:hypothetical protein